MQVTGRRRRRSLVHPHPHPRARARGLAQCARWPLAVTLLAAALPRAGAQDLPQQLPAPPPGVAAAEPGTEDCSSCAPQQLPVPPQMQARFELRRVVFKGATAFDEATLQALVADRIGRTVGFAELQALAQAVTRHYRLHGYLLAQAVLPVQEVADGTVEISIVEGRLGKVSLELDPAAPVSEARIRAMLAPLREGEPLNGPAYERTMLLLSDLPGIRPQSVLEAGREGGSNDLAVEVAPASRLRYTLELDNHGTREVGRWRLGGTVRWASPLRIGDNLDLRVLASDERLLEGEGTVFGRLAYELPLGGAGTRLGFGASRVSYSLGGAFEPLDAVGIARIYDIGAMHPVVRQRAHNLFARGFVDRKELTDELRAVGFTSDKRVTGVGLGWAWERRDGFGGGGYFSSNGVLYHGELDLLDAASRAADASIFGRGTAGDFNKLTVQLGRLQRIADRVSLYASIGAQATDSNLDASEKLALGGPRAVRAYASGEVLVDQGVISNLELRWAASPEATAFVFHDIGSGRLNHEAGPFDLDNRRTLRGAGVGVSYAGAQGLSLNATVAWRTTRRGTSDGGDRNPRFFVSMMKSF